MRQITTSGGGRKYNDNVNNEPCHASSYYCTTDADIAGYINMAIK